MTISQLATTSVDALCDAANNLNNTQAYEADFQHLFHNITHVAAEVELGIEFDMQAQISEMPKLDLSTSINLATVPATALPTQCLVFQTGTDSATGFTPAASVLKAVQVSASASAASASAAASSNAAHQSGPSGTRRTGYGELCTWMERYRT